MRIVLKPLELGSSMMKSNNTRENGVASSSGEIGDRGTEGRFGRFFVDWHIAQPST